MPIQSTSIWLREFLQLSASVPWLLWRQVPKTGDDVFSSGRKLSFQGIPRRKHTWGPPQLWEPWSSVLLQQLQRGAVFKPPTSAGRWSIGGGFVSHPIYALQHPPNQCNWQWWGRRSKVVARIVIFKTSYKPEKCSRMGNKSFPQHCLFSQYVQWKTHVAWASCTGHFEDSDDLSVFWEITYRSGEVKSLWSFTCFIWALFRLCLRKALTQEFSSKPVIMCFPEESQNKCFDGICHNFVGITLGVSASEIFYDRNVILAAVKYYKAWRVKLRMILQCFTFFLWWDNFKL